MSVQEWVKNLVEDVAGSPPVRIGGRYRHPEDGLIEVVDGQYWGSHGLSNFWYWKILATGEIKSGYGGEWPEAKQEWQPLYLDPTTDPNDWADGYDPDPETMTLLEHEWTLQQDSIEEQERSNDVGG